MIASEAQGFVRTSGVSENHVFVRVYELLAKRGCEHRGAPAEVRTAAAVRLVRIEECDLHRTVIRDPIDERVHEMAAGAVADDVHAVVPSGERRRHLRREL